MSDDLFTASIVERPPVTEPPFHLGTMFVPAFFGGPLAFLHFGLASARRLHEPADRRRLLVGLTGGVLLVALVVAVLAAREGAEPRQLRLTLQVAGVVAFLAANPILRPGQRRYEVRGGDYERIGFGRGFAVCLAYGIAQGVLVAVAVGLFA